MPRADSIMSALLHRRANARSQRHNPSLRPGRILNGELRANIDFIAPRTAPGTANGKTCEGQTNPQFAWEAALPNFPFSKMVTRQPDWSKK